jgi:hypothetical protein
MASRNVSNTFIVAGRSVVVQGDCVEEGTVDLMMVLFCISQN